MDVPYFALNEKSYNTVLYNDSSSLEDKLQQIETLRILKYIDSKRLYTYHLIKVKEQKKPIK